MSLFLQIADMAKLLSSLAEAGERRMTQAGECHSRTAVERSTLEGLRWHVRGLFVAAYSEPVKHSRRGDEARHKAVKIVDKELSELGNKITGVTARLGPLFFPSDNAVRLDEGEKNG